MVKSLNLRLSSDAVSMLLSLSKQFDMSTSEALSWVLVETSPPVIPKRGKSTRSTSTDVHLSEQAQAVLSRVVTQHESSESIVVEAYLGREYR